MKSNCISKLQTNSIWILERLVLRFYQEVTLLWHVSMTGYVRHTLETTFLVDISMLWTPRSVSFQLHWALGLEISSFVYHWIMAHGVMASRSKIKAEWFPRYISPFWRNYFQSWKKASKQLTVYDITHRPTSCRNITYPLLEPCKVDIFSLSLAVGNGKSCQWSPWYIQEVRINGL